MVKSLKTVDNQKKPRVCCGCLQVGHRRDNALCPRYGLTPLKRVLNNGRCHVCNGDNRGGRVCPMAGTKKKMLEIRPIPIPISQIQQLVIAWNLEFQITPWMQFDFITDEDKDKFIEIRRRYPQVTSKEWKKKSKYIDDQKILHRDGGGFTFKLR